MKKKWLWQGFLPLVLAGVIYACSKSDNEPSSPGDSLSAAALEAKVWFESQKQVKNDTLSWKLGSMNIALTPDWTWVFPSEDADYKVAEVHFKDVEKYSIVSSECAEKYRQTGDKRYMTSDIRLVIRTGKSTGEKDGFIMVAFPDLSYLQAHINNPLSGVTYLKCPSDFGGTIYFCDMDGNFVNGWIYIEGVPNPFLMASA